MINQISNSKYQNQNSKGRYNIRPRLYGFTLELISFESKIEILKE
jgi:hypothetical protein